MDSFLNMPVHYSFAVNAATWQTDSKVLINLKKKAEQYQDENCMLFTVMLAVVSSMLTCKLYGT